MLILSDTFSRSTMNSAKKTNIQDTLQTFHEFGFWSRVEGTKSRVEGNMSRVEGNMSRVLKNENKIIKIKRKTSLGFGLYANKSDNVPLVHDKTNK